MSRPGASPAAIAIREAVPDDAEAISALILSLADRFLADPDDRAAAEPFFSFHTPEAMRGILSDARFRYRVAEEGGALPVYERFGFVVAGEKVEKDGIAFVPMVLDEC